LTRRFHLTRETLPKWRDNILIVLAVLSIVGAAGMFDQWLNTGRKHLDLEFCVAYFVAGCLIFALSPNRAYIAAVSFGLVAALGTVNALISHNFVAMPLISVCAVVFIAICWWKASAESKGK
jgi:hypothetical protein